MSPSVLRQGVVYERDDRVEALDYPDARLVASTIDRVGALLPRSALTRDGESWLLAGSRLQDELPLCEGEPFAEQMRLAFCTAMLLGPDVIMTAGHCMGSELASDYVFVRGYHLNNAFPRVAAADVHEIDRLLSKTEGDLASLSSSDIAILRLRTEWPLPSLELRREPEPMPGERVVVVGASEGLPIKIDDGATVLAASSPGYFEITSDTFGGSSGSPVLDLDGHLRGMLVGGSVDYAWDESSACYRRLVLDSTVERAEIAVRASVLRRELDRALANASAVNDGAGCSVAMPEGRGPSLWSMLVSTLMVTRWRRGLRRRHEARNAKGAAEV